MDDESRLHRLLEILEGSVHDAKFNGIDKTHVDYWPVIIEEIKKEMVTVKEGE